MNTAHRLIAVTELDTDGPHITILSVAIAAPDDRVYDLGIVLRHAGDEWILTALTDALEDDGDEAVAWLQTECDRLPAKLDDATSMLDARDFVVRELGLQASAWHLLDAEYARRKAA